MADVLACIDYARERNWNIITRDTDFFDQLMLDGPPPKVI
jgi:predicted nuclease of predicted toxin-antitoxin system